MSEWTAKHDELEDLWYVENEQGEILYLYAPNVTQDEAELVADTLSHYAATSANYLGI